MNKHSCLPRRSNVLSRVCGTSIDVEDVDFAGAERHLVYMDKVYSRGEATACPLVFTLNTTPSTFQTQLLTSPVQDENLCEEIFGSARGPKKHCWHSGRRSTQALDAAVTHGDNGDVEALACRPPCIPCRPCHNSNGNACEIDENAVFEIVNSFVLIKNFNTRPLCSLNSSQVTVDGLPVDSLFCQGGNYTATIDTIVPEIVQDICIDRGLPTKAFFLITNAGPWKFEAEFVLEGTVNTNGRTCCFRAIFDTNGFIDINPYVSGGCAGSESTEIHPPHWNTGTVNFALPEISIPCNTKGISPIINFSFSGRMSLLNPSITVQENAGRLNLVLNTRVVAEPSVAIEVVKKTLFCATACEGLLPCDGTEAALLAEEEEDDVESLFAPDCQCGSRRRPPRDEVESIQDSNCGNTIVFGTNTSCNSTCRGF